LDFKLLFIMLFFSIYYIFFYFYTRIFLYLFLSYLNHDRFVSFCGKNTNCSIEEDDGDRSNWFLYGFDRELSVQSDSCRYSCPCSNVKSDNCFGTWNFFFFKVVCYVQTRSEEDTTKYKIQKKNQKVPWLSRLLVVRCWKGKTNPSGRFRV